MGFRYATSNMTLLEPPRRRFSFGSMVFGICLASVGFTLMYLFYTLRDNQRAWEQPPIQRSAEKSPHPSPQTNLKFYELLPQMEVTINPAPKSGVKDKSFEILGMGESVKPELLPAENQHSQEASLGPLTPVDKVTTDPLNTTGFVLQAGSFKQYQQADGLKAKLALLGLVARIQTVKIREQTWYRVRLGPYGSSREMEQVREKLDKNSIKAYAFKNG